MLKNVKSGPDERFVHNSSCYYTRYSCKCMTFVGYFTLTKVLINIHRKMKAKSFLGLFAVAVLGALVAVIVYAKLFQPEPVMVEVPSETRFHYTSFNFSDWYSSFSLQPAEMKRLILDPLWRSQSERWFM